MASVYIEVTAMSIEWCGANYATPCISDTGTDKQGPGRIHNASRNSDGPRY